MQSHDANSLPEGEDRRGSAKPTAYSLQPTASLRVGQDAERIAECLDVRRRVFVDEQAVLLDEEVDGLDPECVHFLAELAGRPVGAARLRDAGGGVAKAERVAVLREIRGQGVGAALMRALERTARERGFREVLLGAQLTAIAFYERLGYVVEGEEFLDARIRHRWMRKVIDRS